MTFVGTDTQSVYPSITPDDIRCAIEELRALCLHTVANKVPEDYHLLIMARMTEPILSMALDLHVIMVKNRECWKCSGEGDDSGNDRAESLRIELLLHRSDMSTHVVENELHIEFGNVEGSMAEEVRNYSHRFDGYRSFISDLREGYMALAEEIKRKGRDFATPYVNYLSSMDLVASTLVDDFLLRFTDPGDSLDSSVGRRILQECGIGRRRVLQLKMERLRQYVASEYAVRAR